MRLRLESSPVIDLLSNVQTVGVGSKLFEIGSQSFVKECILQRDICHIAENLKG